MLFLDYDGTLTPIVRTPDRAVLSREARKILKELAKKKTIKLAIISGRSLKDIRKNVKIKNIIYAGNHGLELVGPSIKYTNQTSLNFRIIIEKIKKTLQDKLCSIKGIIIEDKGLTLSLHYRLVKKQDVSTLKTIFYEAIALPRVEEKIHVGTGKKVFEIKPPVSWDKGKIVLWLLARQCFAIEKNNILPVYIGDDTTDEDAFKVLRNKGLTVFVGKPRKSFAEYYLKNSIEVVELLKEINKTRNNN